MYKKAKRTQANAYSTWGKWSVRGVAVVSSTMLSTRLVTALWTTPPRVEENVPTLEGDIPEDVPSVGNVPNGRDVM